MRLRNLICLFALLTASPAGASVFITYSDMPTPSMPGYVTRTFTAVSTEGAITGANFYEQPGYVLGFFGTFNQLRPFGISTTLNDVHPLLYEIAGMNPAADTHFLFWPEYDTVEVPGETATALQASWNKPSRTAATMDLAQIVAPIHAPLRYAGFLFVGSGSPPVYVERFFPRLPEPSTATLTACSFFAIAAIQRRRAARGPTRRIGDTR